MPRPKAWRQQPSTILMFHTATLLDLLPPPSDRGNSSLPHYVVPILPNTSSLIEIAFHQTTLSAWVTILLHQFQISNLSEPILTTCRVVSILPVPGASTICSHPPYQLPGHMRTPQLLYSASRRSLGSVTAIFASCSTTTPKYKRRKGYWPPSATVPAQSTPLGKNVSL